MKAWKYARTVQSLWVELAEVASKGDFDSIGNQNNLTYSKKSEIEYISNDLW